MDHNLDLVQDIPYYTNISDKPFLWFIRYKNGMIVREVDRYTYTSFTSVPKQDIQYFGLYGCGLHLYSSFSDGSMYFYGSGFDKEFRYCNQSNISQSLFQSSHNNQYIQFSPFHLKGFAYDLAVGEDIYNDRMMKNTTTQYYAGYNCYLLIDQKYPVKFQRYFSINIFKYPRSIGLLSKIQQIDGAEYPDIDFFFLFSETIEKNYNYQSNCNAVHPDYRFPQINLKSMNKIFTHKCVLRF